MQMGLPLPEPRKHGGWRPGAGRPPKGPRSSERHEPRAKITRHTPVHVIMRALPAVPSLRQRDAYAAIQQATALMVIREAREPDGFRIIHLSIQRTHIHAIVEAKDKYALARGMQVFQISVARRLNKLFARRKGLRVFGDRYHAVVLSSPRQVRNTLAYVLNNWRHHREGRGKRWKVDPYSTGWQFAGWRERATTPLTFTKPRGYRPLDVWLPRCWLLVGGWKRHRLIALDETPGGTE